MDIQAIYLKDLRRHPLLSREEECRLARAAQAGCTASRQRLIVSNLRLVVSIAAKCRRRWVSIEDRIQLGNLGLMHAITKFDPDRGYKLSTYATYWIRQVIERWGDQNRSLIHVPYHALVKRVRGDARFAQFVERAMSVQAFGEVETEFLSGMADDEPTPDEAVAARMDFEAAMDQLDARALKIVRERMQGRKLKDIAAELGCTRQRVQQIEFKSFQELARHLAIPESPGCGVEHA